MGRLRILAPTLLEYLAAACALPIRDVTWAGVGLARWRGTAGGARLVICGLAGALAEDVPPGTVLIPARIGLPDGRSFQCDSGIVQALVAAARAMRLPADTRPMLTSSTLVVGEARAYWARRGFASVDMETGKAASQGTSVATIRVALDGPRNEISRLWERPLEALRQPALRTQGLWLVQTAPRYALRAARVLNAGLQNITDG